MELLAEGPKLHSKMGIVQVEATELNFNRKNRTFLFRGKWFDSYEAKAHIEEFGVSETPVCYSLCGYGSGWCSSFFGSPLIEIETKCMAQGHPHCEWEIRPPDDFGITAEPWVSASNRNSKTLFDQLEDSRNHLQKLNKNLNEHVIERTRMIQNLLKILCHDIKEPIQIIQHELKKENINQDLVQSIISNMVQIAEGVQNQSRLMSLKHKIKIKPSNIDSAIKRFIKLHLNLLEEKGISVKFENYTATYALVDDSIFSNHIFSNAFKNAMKHSPYGSTIKIDCYSEGRQVIVSIRDQGIGIPKKQLKQINTDLSRNHIEEIASEGQKDGIGLKLSSSLARSMNGKMRLKSRFAGDSPIKCGTTCEMIFPAAQNL